MVMRVISIAINTFIEAIRDKILYSLLFFAVLLVVSSIFLARLTIGEYSKIIKDIGLSSISFFGTLIALSVGVSLVYREMERKTIYNIISKPVARFEFILGKYLGLILTLIVEVSIMSIAYLMVIFYVTHQIPPSILKAIFLIFLELSVITAIAILFSSFTSPFLSGFFTLSFYFIGHLTQELKSLGAGSEIAIVRIGSKVLYYLLPNLDYFDIKSSAVYNLPLSGEMITLPILYATIYIIVLLSISIAIFEKRDFK